MNIETKLKEFGTKIINNFKIIIKNLKQPTKEIISLLKNKKWSFKGRYISIKWIVLLLLILYITSVNAYNLFYVPVGGKPIKIVEDTTGPVKIRYFEKVEVLETTVPPIIETASESVSTATLETKIEKQYQVEEEIIKQKSTFTYPPETSKPPLAPQTEYPLETAAPTVNPLTFTPPTTPPPSTPPPTTPPPTTPPPKKLSTISSNEVLQFSNKLELFELKDGSIIELHISQSQSEVFTIYKENGKIYVEEGDASNEDIELWVTRSAFKELETTDDISYTIKRLDGEGKIAAIQKVSTWTLWRRGYKNLAERLKIM